MSRTIRTLLAVFAVSFALAASACADATGPQSRTTACDVSNPNTCH
jgi:hypothetical protein